MTIQRLAFYDIESRRWFPGAMVARLASIAEWYQKVAGSSPAVVNSFVTESICFVCFGALGLWPFIVQQSISSMFDGTGVG